MFNLSEVLSIAGSISNNLIAGAAYELPLTGGSGPLVVTAIGVGLAGMSLILLILRGKSGNKDKNKPRR